MLKYDGKDEAEPNSNNIPPIITKQLEKPLFSKYEIATILFVAFVSLILAVILDLYVKKYTQEAINIFSEIQSGMTKDEVIIHLSKIPGVDTQPLSQKENTIWISWPYTWVQRGHLIMKFNGDKIEDITFTNGLNLFNWDNITLHAETVANSYLCFFIDYMSILFITEFIVLISVGTRDLVLRGSKKTKIVHIGFVFLFFWFITFFLPSRIPIFYLLY